MEPDIGAIRRRISDAIHERIGEEYPVYENPNIVADGNGRVEREYVHPKEQEFWDQFRYTAIDPLKSEFPRIFPISNQMGLHEEQARDLIRTWQNQGLVVALDNNFNRARITERGRYTTDPRCPASDDAIPEDD